MANEEQLGAAKKGSKIWNTWREENDGIDYDLSGADLRHIDLHNANLSCIDLSGTDFRYANLMGAQFYGSGLFEVNFSGASIDGCDFENVLMGNTILGNLDLGKVIGLETIEHESPSHISTDTLILSKGKIPGVFLQGCGLSDWEIEQAKLYNPDLSNDEFIDIQNRIFDLRQHQAIQVSPLFISYSHLDGSFVDKVDQNLVDKGIRFWRDIHDMKSGRLEKQIDRAIRKNPTVLLVLSEHSLNSDWVEHEVRTARELEKDNERDVLCPIALDDSWKSSMWPKRIMEQIMEYNILDFSEWEDDVKFDEMFRKLIGGLELFYKG